MNSPKMAEALRQVRKDRKAAAHRQRAEAYRVDASAARCRGQENSAANFDRLAQNNEHATERLS